MNVVSVFGPSAARIAVLVPEAAVVERVPALVVVRHHRMRQREGVDVHLVAGVVELATPLRRSQRRARVAGAAVRLVLVSAGDTGNPELPLDLAEIGLQVLVAERPVREVRARDVAVQRLEHEVRFPRPRDPARPVVRATTDQLRRRRELKAFRRGLLVVAQRSRVQIGIGPQVIAVDELQFVAGEVLLRLQPRALVEGDDLHAGLAQHLHCGTATRAQADDNCVNRLVPGHLRHRIRLSFVMCSAHAGPTRPARAGGPQG